MIQPLERKDPRGNMARKGGKETMISRQIKRPARNDESSTRPPLKKAIGIAAPSRRKGEKVPLA